MINYFKRTELLSASQIKAFVKKGIPNKSESKALIIGTIVDAILTENVLFEDICVVDAKVIVPTGQMKTFSDKLYENHKEDFEKGLGISDESYEKAYQESGIKQRSLEKMKEDFDKNKTYFNYLFECELVRAQGKYLLTEDDKFQVFKSIEDLTASPFNMYFKKGFTQLELYTDYFKIKLDSLFVDFQKKTITLVDLKTIMDHTENFTSNIVRFRYDIQANFYHKVVKMILEGERFETNNKEFEELLPKIKDFKLENTFNFVFVSKRRGSEVLEVKYVIEPEKEISDTMLHTDYDINRAVEMHRHCRDNGLEPSLYNYMLLNGSSITI